MSTSETEHQAIAGSDRLTNSSMGTFRACRLKFYWAYVMGWRPGTVARPLRFGSALHIGLDTLAKGMGIEAACEAIRDSYAEETARITEHASDVKGIEYEMSLEAVTVQRLVRGYEVAWRASPVEIIESEGAFDLPIVNPETGRQARIFRQAGRRDRICKLPDSRIALMETKTASEDIGPDSDYRRVLRLNQQISMYIIAAREEGIKVETVLYDVIRKPGIRPTDVPILDKDKLKVVVDQSGERVKGKNKKWRQTADKARGYTLLTAPMTPQQWNARLADDMVRRPEYYFDRFEVARLDSDLDEFRGELWDMAQDIHHCHKSGRWYRNTSACRNFNRLCPYYPLCAGETDTHNGVPAGFRQVENVHEELAESEGAEQ